MLNSVTVSTPLQSYGSDDPMRSQSMILLASVFLHNSEHTCTFTGGGTLALELAGLYLLYYAITAHILYTRPVLIVRSSGTVRLMFLAVDPYIN